MANPPKDSKTGDDIAKRRDAGLRNLLKAPPKTHTEIVGKGKAQGKKKTPAK